MFQRFTIRVKGTTGLVIAAGLMLVVLIAFPAYRVFFATSLGLGLIVAVFLRFRNKYRPVREKDVENKRPLGLD